MILHCVYCQFRDDVSPESRRRLFQELAAFSQTLDGVLAFDFGPNRDFEAKSPKYTDGFIIRFADQAALNRYAAHPTHLALGSRLCDFCQGGADDVIVFDLETG